MLCDCLYALKVFDREGLNYSLSPEGQLPTELLQGPFYSAGAYSPLFVIWNLYSGKRSTTALKCTETSPWQPKGVGRPGSIEENYISLLEWLFMLYTNCESYTGPAL